MKIAFFHNGNDAFIKPIIEQLSKKHEVKELMVQDLQGMFELMMWADVSWFEWCVEHIVQASHLPKVCKIVTRVHRYEVFSNAPDLIKWDYVDRLIKVSSNLDKYLDGRVGDVKQVVIKNGVDLKKCNFVEKKHGYNLAFIAYLHPRKNFPLALQIIKKLVDIDSRYTLYVAGSYQDKVSEDYSLHMIKTLGLEKNVIHCGWIDNINDWLQDINYVLSTSIHESFGFGIAEAMAAGCKPIIHNFDGAESIWDKKWLFNTVDEAVGFVSGEFNSREYRDFVKDNYNFNDKIKEIEKMIGELK